MSNVNIITLKSAKLLKIIEFYFCFIIIIFSCILYTGNFYFNCFGKFDDLHFIEIIF